MQKHLIMREGKWVDVESVPHMPFIGVVPRDLNVGDTYEDEGAVYVITDRKEIDGMIIVSSKEVI